MRTTGHFPRKPGGGDIGPVSPVEVARTRLAENPIWRQNRPRYWGRGRKLAYFGPLLGSLILAVIGVYVSPAVGIGSFGTGGAVFFFLCPIQCLAAFFMIYSFDFFRSRSSSMEEIALTGLGMSDIAYGAYATGVHGAAFLFIPLLAGELAIWFAVDIQAGLLAAILLPAFRGLLYCHTVSRSIERLTARRSADPAFLLWFPFLCAIPAAFCVFLGFLAIPAVAYFLGPRGGLAGEAIPSAVFLFTLTGYILVIWWGRETLARGWRAATENLYRRMEQ